MVEEPHAIGLTRRSLLAATAGLASAGLASTAAADEEAMDLVKQLTGKTPTDSGRVHLIMPASFPNGYTVPLMLTVDSPMTEADHVRSVRILAPRNPIIEVATIHFTPQRSEPRLSTRIRLAGPQTVVAVAEMNDGSLLMARTPVEVATNGCA